MGMKGVEWVRGGREKGREVERRGRRLLRIVISEPQTYSLSIISV